MAEIIKRGERVWLVRIFLGRDEEARTLYHNKTVHGTKRQAQGYATAQEKARNDGTFVEPSRETLNTFLDKWLATAAPQRPNTKAEYTGLLKRYVRPALGPKRLGALRPSDIQKLYSDMEARGLAPRTVRYTHAVLSSALKRAVAWQELPRNPATGVKLPKAKRDEMHALSPEEATAFLKATAGSPHALLFEFALATGMRPSEYLALPWKAVDRKAGTVTIQRVLVEKGFAEPKTPRSRRTVPLPASLVKDRVKRAPSVSREIPPAQMFSSSRVR